MIFQSAGGAGVYCCVVRGVSLTGGIFNTISNREKREDVSSNCTGSMEANVFGHLSATGAWQIHKDVVGDRFGQMQAEFMAVGQDQREAWLRANGAAHKAELHDGPVSIDHESYYIRSSLLV